jgi:hypothetical protein
MKCDDMIRLFSEFFNHIAQIYSYNIIGTAKSATLLNGIREEYATSTYHL